MKTARISAHRTGGVAPAIMIFPMTRPLPFISPQSADPMTGQKLLIANRGEIAVRIARAAAELGHRTRRGLFRRTTPLAAHAQGRRRGRAAGTRGRARISTARRSSRRPRAGGLRRVHPGYGFLSRERGVRARLRARPGLTFVGPTRRDARAVRRQGPGARAGARSCGVPVLPARSAPTTLEEARAFLRALGARRGRW